MARACVLLLYDMLLVRLAVEDYKYQRIKNRYVQMILMLSAAGWLIMPEITLWSRVMGMFVVSLPMFLFRMCFPGSFGGGDVKLTFVCGAFLGLELSVKGTVIAVFLAGIYCIYLICTNRKQKNMQFALGPFLSAGYMIAAFTLF